MADHKKESAARARLTPTGKTARMTAAALTAAAAGAAVLAITGTGTAQAAVSSPARDSQAATIRYCGAASNALEGHVWIKKADSCHDFNLVKVNYNGWYEGGYWSSSAGHWVDGSRGYVYCNAGVQRDRVLLSDVRPGVRMGVDSKGAPLSATPRVWVNY